MKYADIDKLREAGLISESQREAIVAHFKLKRESNRFLVIISMLGGILVATGLILLVAADWDAIPRGVKIGTGLLLLLGAHAGGWACRRGSARLPAIGAALHLLGSLLWLGNIALVGQTYHLSSRAPNAFLLFWVGIAPLPWLLRSVAQHLLVLLAVGVWFGFEVNQEGSWIFFGDDAQQLVLYPLLGLIYAGSALWLRRTSFQRFAVPTDKLGLLLFQGGFYPLTWGILYRDSWRTPAVCAWLFPVMAAASVGLLAFGLSRSESLSRQWRWLWGGTVTAAIGILAGVLYASPGTRPGGFESHDWLRWLTTCGLFVFCLVEIQVGIRQRAEYMVNLGVAFVALIIVATYLNLFGSMARTGLMFLVSGVFLILFGIFLERQRRKLLKKMKDEPTGPTTPSTEAPV